jgi:diaminohydroxyphosphoribosylaminopyrimidine deaminase/5-amino-6-(5-phosphoribosylamino)uracil reductase
VARDGRIISTGYHARAGRAHAEVLALEQAGKLAEGATLYVTLEPCAHQGKTPPCVDRIISSGIVRVVFCTHDPDPRVSGAGRARLEASGISVDIGGLAESAILLNLPYINSHLKRPCTVTLKIASTMDGKIASSPGSRDFITGLDTEVYVHQLRASHQAILIGIDTLLIDRPRLDCRHLPEARDPMPVVLDSDLRIPEDYPWLKLGRECFICCGPEADSRKREQLSRLGARVLNCRQEDYGLNIQDVVDQLQAAGVNSLFVEGGGRVFSSFVDKDIWDELIILMGPPLFGADGVDFYRRELPNPNASAIPVDARKVGQDFILRYLNKKTRETLLSQLI